MCTDNPFSINHNQGTFQSPGTITKSRCLVRRPSLAHLLLCFFFLTNLAEYLSLVLDWAPAPAPASCALYLFTSQFTATLHSTTVLLLGTVLKLRYNQVNSNMGASFCAQ